MGNHKKPMNGLLYCSCARRHDDDGVVQGGGHSAANRKTEKYSRGL